MLRISLFGTGQAWIEDRVIQSFPQQQCWLLFCYLIVNRGRAIPREQLATVFWANASASVSRQRLSNNLWRLRRALQSGGVASDVYLLSNNGNLRLARSGRYWLDVEQYESAIMCHKACSADRLTHDQVTELEEAVGLYQGDLLEGLYEEWCLAERERLRLMHVRTLMKLIRFHEDHGSYEQGLDYGKQVLTFDVTHEQVHRQMMRLYWRLGDKSAALGQYQRCAQHILDELGIQPMPATRQLYREMRHDQFQTETSRTVAAVASAPNGRAQRSVTDLEPGNVEKLAMLRTAIESAQSELDQMKQLLEEILASSKQT